MADDIPRPDSADHASVLRPGASTLTWTITGGGFLLGMLFGGIFLLGDSDEPNERVEVAAQTETPVPQRSTTDTQRRADDIAEERDRLQQELEAAKLRLEVESLKRKLVDLESSSVSVEPPRRSTQSRNSASQSSGTAAGSVSPGDATLAYWNQMNAIILQEAAMRAAPAGGVSAANAGGFLDARIQAGDFAADALRQLETTAVDAQVVKLGGQLAGWYDEGRTVAEAGKHLLTGANVQERQGSSGKQYQAAERSHSQSVAAINAEGEQVRQAMSRKYRLTFPPLN